MSERQISDDNQRSRCAANNEQNNLRRHMSVRAVLHSCPPPRCLTHFFSYTHPPSFSRLSFLVCFVWVLRSCFSFQFGRFYYVFFFFFFNNPPPPDFSPFPLPDAFPI